MPRTFNTATYHEERGAQMFSEQKVKLKEQECEKLAQLDIEEVLDIMNEVKGN